MKMVKDLSNSFKDFLQWNPKERRLQNLLSGNEIVFQIKNCKKFFRKKYTNRDKAFKVFLRSVKELLCSKCDTVIIQMIKNLVIINQL